MTDEGVGAIAVDLVEHLEARGIRCAIGGALSLGVWGAPRGTVDVDLDVFVAADRYEEAIDALIAAGCRADRALALRQALDGSTVVLEHSGYRIDVFVPTIPFYDEAARRVRRTTFRGTSMPFLDAESLAVFKLLFFRSKDLVDLERLVAVAGAELDHAWVRAQVADMMGEDDERIVEWDRIVAEHGP